MNQQIVQFYCPIHPNEQIIRVCVNDNCKKKRLLCADCIVSSDQQHVSHKNDIINLINVDQWIDSKSQICQKYLNQLQYRKKTIDDKLGKLIEEIKKTFLLQNQQLFQLNFTELNNGIQSLIEAEDIFQILESKIIPSYNEFINSINLNYSKCSLQIENDKANCQKLFNLGIKLQKEQQYKDAIQFFDEVLLINNKHVKSLLNKGESLRSLNNFEQSIIWYDKSLEIDPKNVESLFGKSEVKMLHKLEESVQCLNKISQIDSNYKSEDIYFQQGEILRQLRQYKESIQQYDLALSCNKSNVEAYCGKGISLQSLNKHNEACQCFQMGLYFDQNHLNTLKQFSISLIELKKYQEANQCLDMALKIDPYDQNTRSLKQATLSAIRFKR